MLTKAYIVEKSGTNKYTVRIPILESVANNEDLSNTTDMALYEATLSYTPGSLDSYNAGDVVFVQFEDEDLTKVVITGKLYLGNEEEATGFQNTQALNVSNEANLSNNTYIDGTKIDKLFLTRSDFADYEIKMDESITYRVRNVD